MSDPAVAFSMTPADPCPTIRRLPVGAEYLSNGRTHFRIWAPAVDRLAVVINSAESVSLIKDDDGYFSGAAAAHPGDLYQLQVDDDERLYPDPASRYQPEGPHGPSQVVDPAAFVWTDAEWPGVRIEGQIIYEMHLGTFTREGTWAAAALQLAELARIGIRTVELMPVAEFDGRFGWGYDGVDLFAPSHLYGPPDEFRRFVDTAHRHGIGVLLDVVYNHLGPVGNYLRTFARAYFSDRYGNEWGDALNFDGPGSRHVREFFLANAGYWIDEFHLDGLRLDATQQIFDESPEHIVTAIGRRVRDAARGRAVIVAAENELQDARLLQPTASGGNGLDAVWNDDFHHAAIVALTGRREAYYSDTHGSPQEFIAAAKYGYLFQGQHYHWQHQARGTPAWGVAPCAFVTFLQNHDQVANSARGWRGDRLTSPARWRAMTALMLLMPGTPMLFQGQEFGASCPFLYFADHEPDLAAAVRSGRMEFLSQFPSARDFLNRGAIDDPADAATFERCKLDFSERESHAGTYAFHQDLLRLRHTNAAFRAQGRDGIDGSVLSGSAFLLRFFTPDHSDDRLLLINLGNDLARRSIADPLVAPPFDTDWDIQWSSEDPLYGGIGTRDLWPDGSWLIPGASAIVLAPGPKREPRAKPRQRRTA